MTALHLGTTEGYEPLGSTERYEPPQHVFVWPARTRLRQTAAGGRLSTMGVE
jgi:hypothetical protein